MFRIPSALVLFLAALAAGGCERLGLEDPAKIAAAKEAEGKAIGAGCRHVGRALEACYRMNPKAQKAAVFAGWREMNDYMASNNIPTAKPNDEAAAEVAPPAAERKDAAAKQDAAADAPKPPAVAANAPH